MRKHAILGLVAVVMVVGLAGCDGGDKCTEGLADYGDGECRPADPCALDTACAAEHRVCGNELGVAVCGVCESGFVEIAGACTTHLPCQANSCSGHGACADDSGAAACTCDSGYTGATCASCATGYTDAGGGSCVLTDPCAVDTSCSERNRACENDSGAAVCAGCLAGFHDEGGACLADQTCLDSTCSFHGACSDASGLPVCTCNPGYAGASCEGCAADFRDYGDGRCLPESHCSELQVKAQQGLAEIRQEQGWPGITLGIQTPDCGTWVGATGMADLAFPGTFMLPEHIMAIGSITKTFTAAVVLQLVDEGSLSLEDTLSIWRTDIPFADSITIRQMLNHRSGIHDFDDFDAPCRAAYFNVPSTHEEIIACVLTQPPEAEPGVAFHYSSTNYLLLGLIIEAVTGNPLHEEVRTRILDPLGLEHTSFEGDELVQPRAHYYHMGMDVTGNYIHPTFFYGAADMISNAADLMVFMRSLLAGDVVSPQALASMQGFEEADLEAPDRIEYYGLGLMTYPLLDPEGTAVFDAVGHSGEANGLAWSLYFPALGVTVSVLTNEDVGATHNGLSFYLAFEELFVGLEDLY